MDSWCVSMKSSTHFSKVRSGFLSNGDEGFWGQRIRGGVDNTDLNKFFAKIARRVRVIKPGATVSVLTSGNGKETLVSNSFTSELKVRNMKHSMMPEFILYILFTNFCIYVNFFLLNRA